MLFLKPNSNNLYALLLLLLNFISLQTTTWLKSIGLKDYKEKDDFRKKLIEWLEKDLNDY